MAVVCLNVVHLKVWSVRRNPILVKFAHIGS